MTSSHRYVATQLAAKVAGAGFLVLAARQTSAPTLGVYLTASVAAGFAAAILDFGATPTVRRMTALGTSPALVVAVARLRLRLAQGCCATGALLLVLCRGRGLLALVALATVLAGLLALNAFADAALLGAGFGGIAGAANVAFNLAALAGLTLVGISGDAAPSARTLLSLYTGGALVASAVFAAALARLMPDLSGLYNTGPWRSRGASSRPDQVDARRLGVVHGLSFAHYRSDILVLSVLSSRANVGLYGVASRVIEVAYALPGILVAARQPRSAQSFDSPGRGQVAKETLALFTALALACGAAMALGGGALVEAVFGARYRDAGVLLALLAPGLVGFAVRATCLILVQSSGGHDRERAWIIPTFLVVAAIVIVVPPVGLAVNGLRGFCFAASMAEFVGSYISARRTAGALDVPDLSRRSALVLSSCAVALLVMAISSMLGGVVLLAVFGMIAVTWRGSFSAAVRDW